MAIGKVTEFNEKLSKQSDQERHLEIAKIVFGTIKRKGVFF